MRNGTGRTRTGTERQENRLRSAWRPIWDDMPARVVFVRSKSPAGIEPRLAKEATSLARAGYEVHAILWDRTRSFPAREIRDGIRIHRYHLQAPEGTPGLARRLPRWQWFVLRKAARLRPDVIHAVDLDTAWASRAAARITGARLVYDVFDLGSAAPDQARPRIHRLLRWDDREGSRTPRSPRSLRIDRSETHRRGTRPGRVGAPAALGVVPGKYVPRNGSVRRSPAADSGLPCGRGPLRSQGPEQPLCGAE
ncbi:MAG: glycosyltransferase family 4 protein [Methanobacteriota archaeon]|nr:MAG: glycosyltransferase family 4 protein [Euryarchaeota archaeon]